MRERRIRDPGELSSRYYLRFGVVDKPGVLAQLAGMLGEHEISISEVVQEGQRQEGKPVTVVGILTGCLIFTADLIRRIDLPLRVAFITASRSA